jgi:hypothetical protein
VKFIMGGEMKNRENWTRLETWGEVNVGELGRGSRWGFAEFA